MPYIPQPDRIELDPFADQLYDVLDKRGFKSGELNYVISRLFFRQWIKQPSYTLVAKVMGTLICVALEFYRRCASPYEDRKIRENGDII